MGPELIALGISFLGSSYFQNYGAQQKQNALKLQQSQIDLQYEQKLSNIQETIRDTLDHQLIVAASRGIGLNNPTFQSFQIDTLRKGRKYINNLNIEKNLSDYNSNVILDNINTSLYANLFGNAEKLTTGLYNTYNQYGLS